MAEQQSGEVAAKGPQSSVQRPKTGSHGTPEAKSKETQPSNLTKLVRRLTIKVKPSKDKDASLPDVQDSAEDKLEGFESRNPRLYGQAEKKPEKASLEVPEPVARARTLSKGQRELERFANRLIFDPTPVKELEKREKAKETMRQSKNARFQRFLEEYL